MKNNRLYFIDKYKQEQLKLKEDMDAFCQKYVFPPKAITMKKGFNFLHFIDFENIKNTWEVSIKEKSMFFEETQKHYAISALFDKVLYMIEKGDIPNIIPMLNGILRRDKPKKFVVPHHFTKYTSVGRGDFRWNFDTYVLSQEEKQLVKQFFKL